MNLGPRIEPSELARSKREIILLEYRLGGLARVARIHTPGDGLTAGERAARELERVARIGRGPVDVRARGVIQE